jgi:hypothetical protein
MENENENETASAASKIMRAYRSAVGSGISARVKAAYRVKAGDRKGSKI